MKLDVEMPDTGSSLDGMLVWEAPEETQVSFAAVPYVPVEIPTYQPYTVEYSDTLGDITFLPPVPAPLQVDMAATSQTVPELEEAFAQPSTSGLIPVKEVYTPYREKQETFDPAEILARVMRRVVYDSPKVILASEKIPAPLQNAVDQTLRYAGLAGQVFVWASAYPGCQTGQWNDQIRKQAGKARYLVAKQACNGCVKAQEGRCAVMHKELVAEVPWERALKEYGGIVDATRTARTGSPQQILKTALMRDAGVSAPVPQHKPQAASLLRAVSEPEKVVRKSDAEIWHEKLVKMATRFVRLGFVTQEQVNQNPQAAINQGAYRLAVQEAREYQGNEKAFTGNAPTRDLSASEMDALKYRTALLELQPLIRAGRLTSLEATSQLKAGKTAFQIWQASQITKLPEVKVAQYVGDGIRPADKAPSQSDILEHMARWVAQAEQKRNAGSELLAQTEAKLAAKLEAKIEAKKAAAQKVRAQMQAHSYSGIPARLAPQEVKPRNLVTASLVHQASQWTLQRMNEGLAGHNLDRVLQERWASQEIHAAVDPLRQEHEGAAGFLYVAAEAYVTEGDTGCRTGAAKHRTSGVKALLEMSRCASCQHVSQSLDGSRSCNLYRKTLGSDFAGKEMVQQMNISQQSQAPDMSFHDHAPEYMAYGLGAEMPVQINAPQQHSLLDVQLDNEWILGVSND